LGLVSLLPNRPRRQIESGDGLAVRAYVAGRMGVARIAVAMLENDPDGVAFARILAYVRAVGAELFPKASRSKPRVVRIGTGRPIWRIAASAQKQS